MPFKDLNVHFRSKGVAMPTCPICGRNIWEQEPPAVLLAAEKLPHVPEGKVGMYHVIPVSCQYCGYVFLMSESHLA